MGTDLKGLSTLPGQDPESSDESENDNTISGTFFFFFDVAGKVDKDTHTQDEG